MLKSLSNNGKPFTLGIIGSGQLARMLAQSAARLGVRTALLTNEEVFNHSDISPLEFFYGTNNDEKINRFIDVSDVITSVSEFTAIEILEQASLSKVVYPTPVTMRLIQDKLIQKKTLASRNLPIPDYTEVLDCDDAIEFGRQFKYPIVLKPRIHSKEGYGNVIIFNDEECKSAWDRFNPGELKCDLLAETFVDYRKELAVIVARNPEGENEVYTCAETIQYRHICHAVISPAEVDASIRRQAQEYALACVEAVGGVGIFGVEMFLTKDGKLLINEIAPRPHNSGHYTIEACYTSQFENCIRAVCGLPLGSANMLVPAAAMVNILGRQDGGSFPQSITEALRHKRVRIHFYNKKTSRIGRKMGHITATGNTQVEAFNRAQSAADAIVW